MNILLVDDRGAVKHFLKGELEDAGHRVMDAQNINDAQSYWKARKSAPVDCIILDLNMSCDGLGDSERDRSTSGLFTGWVWFSGHVLAAEPEIRGRVIILSNYLDEFRRAFPESAYSGIRLIAKRSDSSAFEEVLHEVDAIKKAFGGPR